MKTMTRLGGNLPWRRESTYEIDNTTTTTTKKQTHNTMHVHEYFPSSFDFLSWRADALNMFHKKMWTLKKTKPHPFHRLRLLIIFFKKKKISDTIEGKINSRSCSLAEVDTDIGNWTTTTWSNEVNMHRASISVKITCWRRLGGSAKQPMKHGNHGSCFAADQTFTTFVFCFIMLFFSLFFFLCNSTFANVRCYFVVFFLPLLLLSLFH